MAFCFLLTVASTVHRVRRDTYDAGGGGIRSVEGVLVGSDDVSEDSADRGQSGSIYNKHKEHVVSIFASRFCLLCTVLFSRVKSRPVPRSVSLIPKSPTRWQSKRRWRCYARRGWGRSCTQP